MTAVHIIGLLIAAGFVYLLLPRIIFPLERVDGRALDRAMAGLVLMSAVTIAAMYVLGTFGLLETFGLLPFWAAAWWFGKQRPRRRARAAAEAEAVAPEAASARDAETLDLRGRRRSWADGFAIGALGLFDHVERRGVAGGVATATRENSTGVTSRARRTWRDTVDGSPGVGTWVLRILTVVVLLVSAWLRLSRAVHHVELVPQDSYLALSWTTFLSKGRLLADGTYPQGCYMWLSAIGRFYPAGIYNLIRFGGPLMSTIELLVLYWAVSRTTGSRSVGLLSMAVFGLFAGNPQLLVTWPRQIGAMTFEFAIAFGLASLVFAANWMSEHETIDLVLAACALFVAVTSNTLVIPLLVLGYVCLLVAGIVLGGWTMKVLGWLVGACAIAVLAGSYYFGLGLIRGTPLVDSFTQYLPNNHAGFSASTQTGANGLQTGAAQPVTDQGEPPGHELRTNGPFQLGVAGAAVGVVGSVFVGRNRHGRQMLMMSLTTLGFMLLYDLVFTRFALLFRTRMAWVTGELLTLGIGLGLGATVAVVARFGGVTDLLWIRRDQPRRGLASGLTLASLAVAVAVVAYLWPLQGAVAREAVASGYPQADAEALSVLSHETPLSFTFVGVSEQYQEVLAFGFFTEAWVFARDIRYSEAKDPSYELSIPTDRVYIFDEKQPFVGPQAPPIGPTQEYYRSADNRARIMGRIGQWCDLYMTAHHDMSVIYDTPQLRVYEINRRVDVARALRAHRFTDYTWVPGKFFVDDRDVTLDSLTPR